MANSYVLNYFTRYKTNKIMLAYSMFNNNYLYFVPIKFLSFLQVCHLVPAFLRPQLTQRFTHKRNM